MHRTVGAVMFVLVCLHFVYVIATQRIYTLIEEKRVPPPPLSSLILVPFAPWKNPEAVRKTTPELLSVVLRIIVGCLFVRTVLYVYLVLVQYVVYNVQFT